VTDGIIKYDELVQAALIGVVRDILINTAENGLPGEHHFYITFQTNHPDVNIPPYLKERYEDDMTIVLQNQFWDLFIDDEHFEISLSFNHNKEHLYVPFDEASVEMAEKEENIPIPAIAKEEVEEVNEKDNIVALDTFRNKK